jgi:hypothetical protein
MKSLKVLLSLLLILCLFFPSVMYGKNGESIGELRKKVREVTSNLRKIYSFGEYWTDYNILYVEPGGIYVFLDSSIDYEITITEEHLNKFFASLWNVFGITRFPDTVSITFILSIFNDHSLIVKFPMGAFYDYFRREKITRTEFLKQCEIWIDGEKAEVEGDIIKVLGKKFKMDFTF